MKKGFTLLEILVSIAFLSVLVISVFPVFGWLTIRSRLSAFDSEAALVMQEGIEAFYNISQSEWNTVSSPGDYVLAKSAGKWILIAQSEPKLVKGRYSQLIRVDRVCRNVDTGDRVDCSVGVVDENAIAVKSKVSWKEPSRVRSLDGELLVVDL